MRSSLPVMLDQRAQGLVAGVLRVPPGNLDERMQWHAGFPGNGLPLPFPSLFELPDNESKVIHEKLF